MEDVTTHPNYCPLLYKSLHTNENGTHIHASHCCISHERIKTTHLDFYNDKFLVDSRNNWPTSKIDSCHACWEAEEKGYPSYRQHNIEWLNDIGADPTSVELLRLDYSVGRLCNAKCIICGPYASTTWMAEDHKFQNSTEKFRVFDNPSETLVQHLDLSKLQIVYFTGGEPMMSLIPVAILKKISEQSDMSKLTCQLSTNGSILPSNELIMYWKKCKQVDIFASIDATGSAFEYIRNPLNWKEVEANLNEMFNLSSNVQISIALTLGVHNIDELENTYLWYKSKDWDTRRTQFTIAPCHGTYSFNNATEKLLESWKNKISQMPYPWVEQVLGLLSISGSNDNDQWLSHLNMIDHRRGLVWSDHLPNLYKNIEQ